MFSLVKSYRYSRFNKNKDIELDKSKSYLMLKTIPLRTEKNPEKRVIKFKISKGRLSETT